jgi:glycopeptide antibiotics resistance protein
MVNRFKNICGQYYCAVLFKQTFMRFLKWSFSCIYFLVLIYLVFFLGRRKHLTIRYLNIIPLRNTYIEWLGINYSHRREVVSFYSNFVGNILLFIPFSVILMSAFKNLNIKGVLLIALITSFSIELLQYMLCIGVADVDDVLLNVTGACIGILLLKLLKKAFKNSTTYLA